MRKRSAVTLVALLLVASGVACGKKSGASRAGKKSPAVSDKIDDDSLKARSMATDGAEIGVVRTALNRVRIGDKFYTASVLNQVFGPEALPLVTSLVRDNTGAFGGPCDQLGRLGVNNCGSRLSFSKSAIIPTSMATREGFRTRACEAIVQKDVAIAFAVSQINDVGVETVPAAKDLVAAYELFYPGVDPPRDVATALRDVADGAEGPPDAWRYVFLTLCLSPDWQLL